MGGEYGLITQLIKLTRCLLQAELAQLRGASGSEQVSNPFRSVRSAAVD